jgi:4a-hydroxytetrahydrobiopterin dehydratase
MEGTAMVQSEINKLDNSIIHQALSDLEGWTLDEERPAIKKSFKFKSFSKAFAFMTQVALLAQQMRHHPEWFNVYATVDVVLTTHDVSGVSKLDLDMAKKMNLYAAQYE